MYSHNRFHAALPTANNMKHISHWRPY